MPVTRILNDSRPVVGSFLNRLAHEGFEPIYVNDGMEWEKLSSNPFAAAREMITAVDEAHATFKHKSGGKLTVYFILCNSPEEIAADWWVTRGETSEAMERAVSEFRYVWEGRGWPKKGGENV